MLNVRFALAPAALCGLLAACSSDKTEILNVNDCTLNAALCGEGTTCSAGTKLCTALPGSIMDCAINTNLCGEGTACSMVTKTCLPTDLVVADCTGNGGLCGAGTVCDANLKTCVADCRNDNSICSDNTLCSDMSGRCVANIPVGQTCRNNPTLCGGGAVCNGDVCMADCRADLLGACGNGSICNQTTGACSSATSLLCTATPAICGVGQTCNSDLGFCQEAIIDTGLDFDVQLYDLNIDILSATQAFEAQVNIYLVATKDNTNEIVLDIGREFGIPTGGTYVPYTVSAVSDHDNQMLVFEQDNAAGELTITLSQALAANEPMMIKVVYGGPFNQIEDPNEALYYTGIMQRQGRDGQPVIQTFGWASFTRNWLPSQDHPRDIARFHVDVGIDNDFTVLSNGLPVSQREQNGLKRFVYALRQPVPTYAMHIVAAEFERTKLGLVDGVSIEAFTFPGYEGIASSQLQGTVAAFELMNKNIGVYPFERYAMVQVPGAFGGMEHATVVSVADYLFRNRPVNLNYLRATGIHELIHHWYGDNAHQSEWQAFWLNESLATYLSFDLLHVIGGKAVFDEWMADRRTFLNDNKEWINTEALHYISEPVDAWGASFNLPYQKGPWVLQMLRQQIGDSLFYAFLQDFYEASRFGNYNTDTFLAVLNATTGMDMTYFVNEWVRGRGWPTIDYRWTYSQANQTITLTAEQTQLPEYGTYTLADNLGLNCVFTGEDVAANPCLATIEFRAGQTETATTVSCVYRPTTVATPFADSLLIDIEE